MAHLLFPELGFAAPVLVATAGARCNDGCSSLLPWKVHIVLLLRCNGLIFWRLCFVRGAGIARIEPRCCSRNCGAETMGPWWLQGAIAGVVGVCHYSRWFRWKLPREWSEAHIFVPCGGVNGGNAAPSKVGSRQAWCSFHGGAMERNGVVLVGASRVQTVTIAA